MFQIKVILNLAKKDISAMCAQSNTPWSRHSKGYFIRLIVAIISV